MTAETERTRYESRSLLELAHEFNNLLTAIKGNVEMADLALPESAPARHDLREARDAVDRAIVVARELRDMASR